MNSLSSLFRPWIQEMKQRWEELASAEEREERGDALQSQGPCSTLQSSAFGERISASITIAAPSQTTTPEQ